MVAGTPKFSPTYIYIFFFWNSSIRSWSLYRILYVFNVDGVRNLKVLPPVDDVGCVRVEISPSQGVL